MTDPVHPLVLIAQQCVSDSELWFPEVAHSVSHHTLGLAGEVGEFANMVKKVERGSLDGKAALVRHDMAMELTDTFIYVMNLAGLMHINMEQAYILKRTENMKRFG